jgi:lipopolysaccharide biosynthesis glycosyltransferase
METIKIFIGSEPGNQDAEITLAWSISQTTSGPYEINWMSEGIPCSIWQHWNKGRDHNIQNTKTGWKTNFSAFRWAIPELCNFKGKAIYLDVDQIVLKDIRNLWDLPVNDFSYLAINNVRTDVMLLNCDKFENSWWPSINKMKISGHSQRYYRQLVEKNTKVGNLDKKYNCLDGEGFDEETSIIHFTKMSTQPWKPFPQNINYQPHKNKIMQEIWETSFDQAKKSFL